MSRLLATVGWEAQLQFRYGFYYAGAVVALIWIALFSLIPAMDLALLLPVFLFGNLTMTTFYFVAGLVLLEKAQHTLQGLVVTPLRRGEYLAAKIVTLTWLALLESVLIVGLSYGLRLNWLWLLLGLLALAAIYTLAGFIFVSRYDSINEYLMPSGLVTLLLSLPLIDYFELWPSLLFYLLPTQPPLLLLRAAFQPVAAWQLIYAGLGSLLWIGVGYAWSKRVFQLTINN
ncbi:MAG: ABC transporter permease [Anaerolineae bacterium]|nr:ABC transporter permease [Anaerolineae bacterium]